VIDLDIFHVVASRLRKDSLGMAKILWCWEALIPLCVE
jgi:hypothetical protein